MLLGFIFFNVTNVMSDQVTVIRDMPDSVAKGSTFTVTLSIDVDEGDLPFVLGVRENIPDGCTFSSASSDGFNFESDNTIEWIFLESSLLTQIISEGITFINLLEDQSITYTLNVPSDFSGDTVTFSGTSFFGGTTNPATGGDVELALSGVLGDADGDSEVNYADLLILAVAYNTGAGDDLYDSRADFDNDEDVDYNDLLALAANYSP